MKKINKIISLCFFVLTIVLGLSAIFINGGILYAIIGAATFIIALSLLICRTNPILCSCFNLLLYAIILFEFLFIGKFIHAILIDILLLGVFSAVYIKKKKLGAFDSNIIV